MPEPIIPPNARVIEWYTERSGTLIAQRVTRYDDWLTTDLRGYQSEETLRFDFGLTAENLTVLASFPEPTLEEVLDGVNAFTFQANFKGRSFHGAFFNAVLGEWRVTADDDQSYDDLAELDAFWNIDLSTVTPLVPRGES